MARPNKIEWWEQKGEYCVTIRGKLHRFGPDRDKAVRRFHTLLAAQPEEQKLDPQSMIAVMDTFLDEASFKSEATRAWHQKHCQSFTDYLPRTRLVGVEGFAAYRNLCTIPLQPELKSKAGTCSLSGESETILQQAGIERQQMIGSLRTDDREIDRIS